MQLCFDSSRFGFGLKEAIALSSAKSIPAVEYAFDSFSVDDPASLQLHESEKEHLLEAQKFAAEHKIEIACIRLNYCLDMASKSQAAEFPKLAQKLTAVAAALNCKRISFSLKPSDDDNWLKSAEKIISPVIDDMEKQNIKLLLRTSTPDAYHGVSLRKWRPLSPQEWRDLLGACPGLSLSFSVADSAWQGMDYLQILPGLVPAIEHVEAADMEINRSLLADSGMYGPLWWRYRIAGKGQVDWRQFIEALKLYDYQGNLSIQLADEFVADDGEILAESLDMSIKLLAPLVKY